MKRDMDLVREIMIEVEKNPDPMTWADVNLPGHSGLEISYHIKLLHDQGLLVANDCSDRAGMDWKARHLTYEGRDFLEAARSDTVWNKAKEKVISTTGTLSLEGLKLALPMIIRALISGGS